MSAQWVDFRIFLGINVLLLYEEACPLNQSEGSGPGKDIGSHDKLCAISQNFGVVNVLVGGTGS